MAINKTISTKISTGTGTYTIVDIYPKTSMDQVVGLVDALGGKIDSSKIGAASGVAPLNADGKISSTHLPSYVDDVLEFASVSQFPSAGEGGKIYVDTSSNRTYRYSGSGYVEISASLALGVTYETAYRGLWGKENRDNITILQDTVSDIIDGITKVPAAVKADKADKADEADEASKVTQKLTISGDAGAVVFDGSVAKTVSYTNVFAVQEVQGDSNRITVDLKAQTYVDDEGVYSVVKVNKKGIITAGQQAFKVIDKASPVQTDYADVAVGGLVIYG